VQREMMVPISAQINHRPSFITIRQYYWGLLTTSISASLCLVARAGANASARQAQHAVQRDDKPVNNAAGIEREANGIMHLLF